MKKFINKQSNCFLTLILLVILCESLLNLNNRITQLIGIVLTPAIAVFVFLLIRNDKKKLTK